MDNLTAQYWRRDSDFDIAHSDARTTTFDIRHMPKKTDNVDSLVQPGTNANECGIERKHLIAVQKDIRAIIASRQQDEPVDSAKLVKNTMAMQLEDRDIIESVYDRYMTSLLSYPVREQEDENIPVSVALVQWYRDNGFPGSQDPDFSAAGMQWQYLDEFVAYLKDVGLLSRTRSLSDETVQRLGLICGSSLLTHTLLPLESKRDGKWRLAVAIGVEEGSILGLLPGRLRYIPDDPHLVKSNWLQLPNGVCLEPTPSIFDSVFWEYDDAHSSPNVAVAYERVDDHHLGFGPSFRAYIVARRDINPLETLLT
jgi:hypothetical protein